MPASRRAFVTAVLAPLLGACAGQATATSAPTVAPSPTPVPAPSVTAVSPVPTTRVTGTGTGFAERLDLTNPRLGGHLTLASMSDVRTLNPLFVTDAVTAQACALTFSGLVKLSPTTLQPEDDLAVEQVVSADGLQYTFRLRTDATFHDGRPVTAEDVQFTYELLLKRAVAAPRFLDLTGVIEDVKATSPTEVVFQLKSLYAPFLTVHAGYGIVPKHLLQPVEPNKIEQGEFSQSRPIGSGPFRVQEWRKGSQLTLVRHDGYHLGRPHLDRLDLKVFPGEDLLLTALRQGEIDATVLPDAVVAEVERLPDQQVSRVDSLALTYLLFQLDPARSTLFQDRQMRLALALGIDRAALIRDGRGGLARLGGGVVPPPLWAADEQLTSRLPYDPNRAETILDSLGWKREQANGTRQREGKALAFTLVTNRAIKGNQAHERYAKLIQTAWQRLGADVKLLLVGFPELLDRLRRTRDFDICLTAYAGDADPDQRQLWSTDAYRTGFNAGRYTNPTVDQLATDAAQAIARLRRRELYARLQEMLITDLPAVVLDYPQAAWAVHRRARNVIPNPSGLAYNAHQWWAADGR